jgi:hypothetical protein
MKINLYYSMTEGSRISDPQLINLKGRKGVRGEKISDNKYYFNVSPLAHGIYLLIVCSIEGERSNYIRIVK